MKWQYCLALFCHLGIILGQKIGESKVESIAKMIKSFEAKSLVVFSGPSINNSTRFHLAETYFKLDKQTFMQFFHLDSKKARMISSMDTIVVLIKTEKELQITTDLVEENRLGTSQTVLIILLNQMPSVISYLGGVRIDQEVFVINAKNKSVLEVYSINNSTVSSVVGTFDTGFNLKYSDPEWTRSVHKRRQDFQGLHLKAMTEQQRPYLVFESNFKTEAKFSEKDQTYDVTDFVSGMYYEILMVMAKNLNFTVSFHKRKDGVWGGGVGNKTTGMIKNLAMGEADLIAAPLTMNIMRAGYVDFLPVVTSFLPALFIKSELPEVTSWTMYLHPLTVDVWFVMILVAIAIGSWLYLGNRSDSQPSKMFVEVTNFIGWLWMAFTANFSGKPKGQMANKKEAFKIVILTCLLAGTVIWMQYRASMTSDLSIVRVKYPFTSLTGILGTPFKFGTNKKGSATAGIFLSAPEGSVEHELLKNHMPDDESFVTAAKGLENILDQDAYAYFQDKQTVLGQEIYDCRFTTVWQASVPMKPYSFATRKKSPVWPIMKTAMLAQRESGQFHFLRRRFLKETPNCKPLVPEVKALSMHKLASLFFVVILGLIGSLLGLILELTLPSLFQTATVTPIRKFSYQEDEMSTKDLIREFLQQPKNRDSFAKIVSVMKSNPLPGFEKMRVYELLDHDASWKR